jgi:hypothetical protein
MGFTTLLFSSLLLLFCAIITSALLFWKYKKSKIKSYRNLAIVLIVLIVAYVIACML